MAMYDYLYFCIFLFVWIYEMKSLFPTFFELTVFPVCSILTGNKKQTSTRKKKKKKKRERVKDS